MVTHSDEEIEEHLSAALHLNLHRAAPLESTTAADDEGQIMSSKLGVGVRCMAVSPASRGENGGHGYAGLQTLLAEGETLELFKAVAVGGAAGVQSARFMASAQNTPTK